jgi:hypothetical protein
MHFGKLPEESPFSAACSGPVLFFLKRVLLNLHFCFLFALQGLAERFSGSQVVAQLSSSSTEKSGGGQRASWL